MSFEDILKEANKKFISRTGDTTFEVKKGSEVKPVNGIILDNPMMEFLLDRPVLPYGRCYLSYGKKGCAKTSLFYEFAKLFQSHGGYVVWVETEKAADLDYAAAQGVDLDRLMIPDIEAGSLEAATTYIETLVRTMQKTDDDDMPPTLICLDSIAGCVPDYELQDKITVGATKVGEHAKIMSSFYRRISAALETEKAMFLAINQLKKNINTSTPFGGDDEALISGEAQRFHSTYQFKLARKSDNVAEDPESGMPRKIGSTHTIKVVRNKLGREGASQEGEFDLYINGGIDWYSPLVRKLSDPKKGPKNVIDKNGGWYKWLVDDIVLTLKDPEGNVIKTTAEDVGKGKKDKTAWRESELGIAIRDSKEAKDYIRNIFKIPKLPTQEIIAEVEKERKTKRKQTRKKLKEEEEITNGHSEES